MRPRSLASHTLTWTLILTGSLLLVGATAATLTPLVAPESSIPSWFSFVADLLPISGGANHNGGDLSAPEIDPGSIANAVALVFGGALLVVGLRRRG